MNSVNFSVGGDALVWVGATDSSLSLETKGFLWWLLATGNGLIEVSEYSKPLSELMASGYLIIEGEADAVIMPSPFARIQAPDVYAKNHPLAVLTKGRKGRQQSLGVRFFPKFQESFNELKAPAWGRCLTVNKAKTDALGAYLKECKRLSQGEFLVFGLDIFEKALMYAANDYRFWRNGSHQIGIFLNTRKGHPFDLAELYRPNNVSPLSQAANSFIPARSLAKRLTA